MRILVNALSARRGGGQTYLSYLLRELPTNIDRLYILASKSFAVPSNEKITILNAPDETENPVYRAIWETFNIPRLIRKEKISVLFAPGGTLPLFIPKGCRSVVTFQNMLPFWDGLKNGYPFGPVRWRLQLLKRLFLKSMEKADFVIFISNYAANFITKTIGAKINDYTIIPHGLDEQFKTAGDNSVAWPVQIQKGQKYFCYVSIFEPYKHQLEVVKAFRLFLKASNSNEHLVLAGFNDTPYGDVVKEAIKEEGINSNVLILGNVPHAELPNLYHHAEVNIFASTCENCPNILLEKMGSGSPLICSKEDPMPEFAKSYGIYFLKVDASNIAQAMIDTVQNQFNRNCEQAFSVEELNWPNVSEKTWAALAGKLNNSNNA